MRIPLLVLTLLVGLAHPRPTAGQDDAKLDAKLKPYIGKYEYPKAVKDRDSIVHYVANGALHEYQGVYTTPDDVGEVHEWFCKNLLKTKNLNVNYSDQFKDGPAIILNHPLALFGTKKEKRPVEILLITQDTKEYTWTVVISRAKEEKLTHIALAVLRKQSK